MKKIWIAFCFVCLNIASVQMHATTTLKASSVASQPLLESEAFHLINEHRVANLLKPLKWSSSPAHVARKHSINMAKGTVPFGHQGLDLRFDELKSKIASLTGFGENVAYNFGYSSPAKEAVKGWLASPGHYANIMGDYNLTGIGVAKNLKGEYYFTQIFVKAEISELNLLDGNEVQPLFQVHACDTSIEMKK